MAENNWGALKELAGRYMAAAESDALFTKRRTGFENLDGTGKFELDGQKQIFSPQIYFIGAPPSAGKTTWALQLLSQLADRGEECLFLSYEMGERSLFRKLISRRLFEKKQDGEKVNLLSGSDIRRAGLTNDDVNLVITELAENSKLRILRVDWEASTLIKKLYDFVGALDRPPVICLDYLQLVPNKAEKTAKDKIDSLLPLLRKFQVETNSTLILISSFNRANGMMSEATFSSFKESGAIEYTADVLLVLEPVIKGTESMTEADKRERKKKIRAMRLRCLKAREDSLYEVFFRYHAVYDVFVPCSEHEVFEEPDAQPRHCK